MFSGNSFTVIRNGTNVADGGVAHQEGGGEGIEAQTVTLDTYTWAILKDVKAVWLEFVVNVQPLMESPVNLEWTGSLDDTVDIVQTQYKVYKKYDVYLI